MISHFILLLWRCFLCLLTTWIWGVSVWISLCLPYLALFELLELKVNVFHQIGTLSTIISANIFSLPFVSLLLSFLLHVCWYCLYPTGFWGSVHFFFFVFFVLRILQTGWSLLIYLQVLTESESFDLNLLLGLRSEF